MKRTLLIVGMLLAGCLFAFSQSPWRRIPSPYIKPIPSELPVKTAPSTIFESSSVADINSQLSEAYAKALDDKLKVFRKKDDARIVLIIAEVDKTTIRWRDDSLFALKVLHHFEIGKQDPRGGIVFICFTEHGKVTFYELAASDPELNAICAADETPLDQAFLKLAAEDKTNDIKLMVTTGLDTLMEMIRKPPSF